VTAVSVDRGSLRVGFADGVRERFDLVVGADGPRSGLRSLVDAGEPSGPRLHDWSFRTGGEADGPTEVWGRDALATVVPDGDGAVCRVTAAPDAVDDAGPDALASVAERLGWRLPALVAGAEAVDYERRRHADGGTRIAGRVAFCGAAAHPLAPASGVVAPLALGDARVLADELRFGPDDLADVLGGYGRRRQRRIADLRHAAGVVGEGAYPPPGTGASLSAVGRLRSVALRSVLDA
jgi:2-polyprenyl-6-methoxyphenol hydroxylase-like FAD-dependent oxidoreductase